MVGVQQLGIPVPQDTSYGNGYGQTAGGAYYYPASANSLIGPVQPKTSGTNPVQIASNLSNVGSLFNSGSITGGTVPGGFNAVNTFGNTYLGTELPGVEGTGLLGSSSLTGALSGAGIGGLVGNFNPLVKNKTGGMVGGTVGGLVGQALIPIPFVGAAIGGFIGSSLGGLIGGGTPHPGASFESVLDKNNNYTSPTVLGKHMSTDGPVAISQEMQPYLQNLKANNINIPENMSVGVYYTSDGKGVLFSRDKGARDADTKSNLITFDPNDTNSRTNAYSQLSQQLAQAGGATPEQLAALAKSVPANAKGAGGLPTAAPTIAMKDTNPNLANNSWSSFMTTYNQRNQANG